MVCIFAHSKLFSEEVQGFPLSALEFDGFCGLNSSKNSAKAT